MAKNEKLDLTLICPFHEFRQESGAIGSDIRGFGVNSRGSRVLLTPDRVSDFEGLTLVTPVETKDNQSSSST